MPQQTQQTYARIVDNTAVEIFTVPEGFAISDCLHPSLLSQFIACPADLALGSVWMNGRWNPAAA